MDGKPYPWVEKIMSKEEELAMQGSTTDHRSTGFVAIHPLDPEDAAITAAMRAMTSSAKGARPGNEARGQFDAFMESVLPREDVTFEADTLGGIPGLWVHPADWRSDEAIVHLHGGWFSFGSAKAYRHLVGHIAARAGARAFIPDYRLAPEHPFPAATDDVLACYQGLAERAFTGLLLPETPLEAIWHWYSRRALPAKLPPSTRLLSELLCCRRLPT
jgi:acetyl esterase/lipase